MRVALVEYRFPSRGNPYIWDWVRQMVACGLDITVFTEGKQLSEYSLCHRDLLTRIRVFNSPFRIPDRTESRLAVWWENAPQIMYRLPKFRLIVSSLGALSRGQPPRRAARKLMEYLPFLGSRFDIVHFNTPNIALRRLDIAQLFGARTLISFRGEDLSFHGVRYKPLLEKCDHLHFISEHLHRLAVASGYQGGKHTLIPPIIDTDFYRPIEKNRSQTPEVMKLFTAAKLAWRKGYEFALQAVYLLIQRGYAVEYTIAGTGEFQEAIIYTINQLGIQDHVRLVGWLSPEQVLEQLGHTDIYLLTSVEEAFNNSVLQAQACEVPVVCSNEGGLPENIAHGKTGLLVRTRDAWDTAAKIALLLDSAELRLEMGKAGRTRVIDRFSLSSNVQQFIGLYQRLVSECRV